MVYIMPTKGGRAEGRRCTYLRAFACRLLLQRASCNRNLMPFGLSCHWDCFHDPCTWHEIDVRSLSCGVTLSRALVPRTFGCPTNALKSFIAYRYLRSIVEGAPCRSTVYLDTPICIYALSRILWILSVSRIELLLSESVKTKFTAAYLTEQS